MAFKEKIDETIEHINKKVKSLGRQGEPWDMSRLNGKISCHECHFLVFRKNVNTLHIDATSP